MVVTDVPSERMRAIIPVSAAYALDADRMRRLLQANSDPALNSCHAAAPEEARLIPAIAQTGIFATTCGTLHACGALRSGGGDSDDCQRELVDRHLRKGVDN